MNPLLVIDTADDRREVHYLLTKLPPADRVAFVSWACRQAPQGPGRLPAPVQWGMGEKVERARRCDREDLKLSNECYCSLVSLINDFGVDPVKVVNVLEQVVKRPEYRRAVLRRTPS